MRKAALVSVISIFVTGLFITGFSRPAVAQETYYGCYNTRSGALRIVTNPALCTSKESPMSWLSAEGSYNLATRGPKVVFASSGEYAGDLGGLVGADAKCQTLADAAGLPGTFKAWLSDSTASPSTRFNKWPFGYALVNGTVVANSWLDLTDGSINNPISIDENGNAVNPPPNTYLEWVWTGTDQSGMLYYPAPQSVTCLDWTSSNGTNTGLWGATYLADYMWTDESAGMMMDCSRLNHIYCFQQ